MHNTFFVARYLLGGPRGPFFRGERAGCDAVRHIVTLCVTRSAKRAGTIQAHGCWDGATARRAVTACATACWHSRQRRPATRAGWPAHTGPRRCSEVDRATLTDYQFMTAAAPCPSAALFEGGPLRTDATAVSGGYCGKTADALRTALIHNAICCGKTADALLRTQHA